MPNLSQFWILDFGFWISKPKIENLKSKISTTSGQALVEFTIALVAVLAVAAGMLALNRLEWARLSAMTAARGNAGDLALASAYLSAVDASFILDWQTGADGKRYTPDDQTTSDLAAISLIGELASHADAGGLAALPGNAISRLGAAADPIDQFYLVKGSANAAVDLSDIPAINGLLTGETGIDVEENVWLTWTGGI